MSLLHNANYGGFFYPSIWRKLAKVGGAGLPPAAEDVCSAGAAQHSQQFIQVFPKSIMITLWLFNIAMV